MKKGALIYALILGLFLNNSFISMAAENADENIKIDYPAGDFNRLNESLIHVEETEISSEEFERLGRRSVSRNSLNSLNSSASDKNDSYYGNMLNATDKLIYDAYLKLSRANKGYVKELTIENRDTYGVSFYKGTEKLKNLNWQSIRNAIAFDHPEELESLVYFPSFQIFSAKVNDVKRYNYYFFFQQGESYTGAEVAQLEAKLKSACDSFYNSLKLSGDDFNKELIIHDALVKAMEYNHPVADNDLQFDVAHTAYGAFVNKYPVCDGYAKAFKMLLNKAGIEAYVVAGDSAGAGHAWNIVKIGGDFYEVDVTWDDADQKIDDAYPYKEIYLHEYFNRTTADFLSHKIDLPGIYADATCHNRNGEYLGYLSPAVATGTAKAYRTVKKVYDITFDAGSSDAYYYLPYGRTLTYEGKIIEMPQDMYLYGRTFDNWYTAKEGGKVVTKNTVFSGSATVYARWTGGSSDEGNTGGSGDSGSSSTGEENPGGGNSGEDNSGSGNTGEDNSGENNSGSGSSKEEGSGSDNSGSGSTEEKSAGNDNSGADSTVSETDTSSDIGQATTPGSTDTVITEIKANAYKNNKKLKSYTIGPEVEKIGEGAFKGCKNLKKITISANNLKSVGKNSFKGIKKNAKITIICKNKKSYNKIVKLIKKAGAKNARFKFKKG